MLKGEEVIDELVKELEKRGIAEVSNGVVLQVTQALTESENEVEFLLFGELKKQEFIPIDEACAKCDFLEGIDTTIKECQEIQGEDARARGFYRLICPAQFTQVVRLVGAIK